MNKGTLTNQQTKNKLEQILTSSTTTELVKILRSKKVKRKKRKKKKKKKRRKSTDSPPPLISCIENDSDSDSNDDSIIQCYHEPEPSTLYEHFDPFSPEDICFFNSTQQPELDEDQ